MKFNETTIRILVRENHGECFDFYTEKSGLIPVWGDRNGPYTSFAVSSDSQLVLLCLMVMQCLCFKDMFNQI